MSPLPSLVFPVPVLAFLLTMAPFFLLIVPPLTVYGLFFFPCRNGQPLIPLVKLARPRRHTVPLRVFLGVACLATWFFLISSAFTPHEPWQIGPQHPPDYEAWRAAERALPQNNADLPAPQGRNGKYIRFSNHTRMAGRGRAVQEMVINAHLAYQSGRIFVLYDYDRKIRPGDYNVFSWGQVHARVPISALLAGPIAGGVFPSSASHPPAVTADFFREVCPTPTLVNVTEVHHELDLHGASAATIVERFAAYLARIEDHCVEIVQDSGLILPPPLLREPTRMEDFWPSLLQSPILSGWQWSDLVLSGVDANRQSIYPSLEISSSDQLEGLLALHIQRGDFENRCERAALNIEPPISFNARLATPQAILPPPEAGADTTYYQLHCYPTLMDIVRRVGQVRREAAAAGRKLDRLYVVSSASRGWLTGLKYALSRSGVWESITTSRDLDVTWEQKFVVPGMDMMLASRAEVFVGNAWSHLSSNINLLRISHGYAPETTRFW